MDSHWFGIKGPVGRIWLTLTRSMMKDIDRAVRPLCSLHTCAICLDSGVPDANGSGTLVEIGEFVAIATAAHVLEEFPAKKPLLLGWYGDNNRRFPECEHVKLDRELDVACILFHRSVLHGSEKAAVPVNRLRRGVVHLYRQPVVVCGAPCAEYVRDNERREIIQTYVPLGCPTIPPEHWPAKKAVPRSAPDPYAPSVSMDDWGPSEPVRGFDPAVDILLHRSPTHQSDVLFNPTKPTDPHGLSGGGIWQLRRNQDGSITPDGAQLIGIAIEMDPVEGRWIRGVQIQHWIELVGRTWPRLRREIDDAGF